MYSKLLKSLVFYSINNNKLEILASLRNVIAHAPGSIFTITISKNDKIDFCVCYIRHYSYLCIVLTDFFQ